MIELILEEQKRLKASGWKPKFRGDTGVNIAQLMIDNDVELRKVLVKSTIIDGTLMRSVMNGEAYPEFHISAGINLKKINRWCAFFISLPDSLETLADLNGQSRD